MSLLQVDYKDSVVQAGSTCAVQQFGSGIYLIHNVGINCNQNSAAEAKILLFKQVNLIAADLPTEIGVGARRYQTLAFGYVKNWVSINSNHVTKVKGPFSLVSIVFHGEASTKHTLTWVVERIS